MPCGRFQSKHLQVNRVHRRTCERPTSEGFTAPCSCAICLPAAYLELAPRPRCGKVCQHLQLLRKVTRL